MEPSNQAGGSAFGYQTWSGARLDVFGVGADFFYTVFLTGVFFAGADFLNAALICKAKAIFIY